MSPLRIGQCITGRSGFSYCIRRLLYEREGSPYKIWLANEKYVVKTVNKDQYRQAWDMKSKLRHSAFIRQPSDGVDEENALIFPYYTEDLLAFVRKNLASRPQIKRILFDSLKGIRDLHQQNWVHGDLKPSNILVSWRYSTDNEVVILKSVVSDTEDATKVLSGQSIDGVKPGNVYWRSPEANFGNNIDHKTDIFSFGSVVIYTLSGRVVFAYDKLQDGETPEIAVISNQISYFGHTITKEFVMRFTDAIANKIADIYESFNITGRKPFRNLLIEGLNSDDKQFIEKLMILNPSARPDAEEILNDPWWNI